MNSIPTTKRSTILGLMTHVIVLTIVFILPEVIFTAAMGQRAKFGPRRFDIYIHTVMYIITFYVNYFILIDRLLFKKRTWLYLVVAALFAALMVVAGSYSHIVIDKLLGVAPPPHRRGHHGGGLFIVSIMMRDYVMLILTLGLSVALKMGLRWTRIEKLNERIITERKDMELRNLKNQLNPHFLYNTLDTIKWMGKIHQAPEIATISADLADILRSSISADELVPLRQELRLVERYVEIQNIRFSGAFALTVEVDEPLRDVPVPKLMLQPLVENAILHGFRDRSGGEIRISAYRTEEDLILTVRDNGCGVPEEVLAQYRDGAPRPGGHFGLHNVDAILRIRYGPDRGVRFVPVQGEGACIRITLPVFRKGEEPPC